MRSSICTTCTSLVRTHPTLPLGRNGSETSRRSPTCSCTRNTRGPPNSEVPLSATDGVRCVASAQIWTTATDATATFDRTGAGGTVVGIGVGDVAGAVGGGGAVVGGAVGSGASTTGSVV